MKSTSRWKYPTIFYAIAFLVAGLQPVQVASAQTTEFPQENAWTSSSPSVVWCNDPASTTMLEVHIVGRTDVARVWLTNLGTIDEEGRGELFDDGTHGDAQGGDWVFTLANVVLPSCNRLMMKVSGYGNWLGMLRVELRDGTRLGNDYGMLVGLVDLEFKDAFPVVDFGQGLSATSYAFFIQDTNHEVMDSYPISNVYCGTTNSNAYRKLYSTLPDVFDFALVMPGMQIFRPADLAENSPYDVLVSNNIQNIGIDLMDNTARFGSTGRLKSTIYYSFGGVDIFDHEVAHTWGAAIGQSLGLLNEEYDVNQGHWNKMADMQGQLGAYYFDPGGAIGHLAYNGDGTWRLIANTEVEPYSPLELYLMGLIPPEEVPSVHILQDPNLTNPSHITAASYKTVTIDQVMQAEGGARIPSSAEAQKDFSLAFIVTQDIPYNDAAYAYFSLMSHELMNRNPPQKSSFLAPFYWATGNRGTLDTRLPVEVASPDYLPGDPTPTPQPTVIIPTAMPTNTSVPVAGATPVSTAVQPAGSSPLCASATIAGGIALLPGIWLLLKKRQF